MLQFAEIRLHEQNNNETLKTTLGIVCVNWLKSSKHSVPYFTAVRHYLFAQMSYILQHIYSQQRRAKLRQKGIPETETEAGKYHEANAC